MISMRSREKMNKAEVRHVLTRTTHLAWAVKQIFICSHRTLNISVSAVHSTNTYRIYQHKQRILRTIKHSICNNNRNTNSNVKSRSLLQSRHATIYILFISLCRLYIVQRLMTLQARNDSTTYTYHLLIHESDAFNSLVFIQMWHSRCSSVLFHILYSLLNVGKTVGCAMGSRWLLICIIYIQHTYIYYIYNLQCTLDYIDVC